MKEEFRQIDGAPGYFVSNLGRVRSSKSSKCLREAKNNRGYSVVGIYNAQHKLFTQLVHRLVAKAFIDNPEGLPHVNHLDGNKQNNRVDNLEWSSPSRNQRHAIQNGLRKPFKGSNNPKAKLNESRVRIARSLIKSGHSDKTIGNCIGVDRRSVFDIRRQKTWQHVRGNK